MDYKQIIDKLVRELSYRVGIPNIENKEHQSIMSEILSEWGEYDVKERIFEFLTEKDEKFNATSKKSGETVTFQSIDWNVTVSPLFLLVALNFSSFSVRNSNILSFTSYSPHSERISDMID